MNLILLHFLGTKNMQSNLNEIGKSEQKGSELDKKRNRDWSNSSEYIITF